MIVHKLVLAARVTSLPAELQDAVRLICMNRCSEATRKGRETYGPSWGRDIAPCVNAGEVCQGCIDLAGVAR